MKDRGRKRSRNFKNNIPNGRIRNKEEIIDTECTNKNIATWTSIRSFKVKIKLRLAYRSSYLE
jgi:hypothetical protein